MSRTLWLEESELMVEVDDDGSVEQARVHVKALGTDIDCTDFIKNSKYWLNKISEENQHRIEELRDRMDYE